MDPSPPAPTLHVVLLPFPTQGHVNPLVLIARLLANKGFNCTVVLTLPIYRMIVKGETLSRSSSSGWNNGIQFLAINESPTASSTTHHGSNMMPGFSPVFDVMMRMKDGFEDSIKNLHPSPSCLISDTFVTWSHDAAQKLQLPRFAFYSSNASVFCTMFHAPMLITKGLLPFTDASYEDPRYFIDCIPGLPPLRPKDFPRTMQTQLQFVSQQIQCIEKDEGVIINTTHDLERGPLDALQRSISVFPCGPLCLFCDENYSRKVNFWNEDTSCIRWLQARDPFSVLYVSFGSRGGIVAKQMFELAEGLEASQQPFLWVIRPDGVKEAQQSFLPEGFAERTKHRGLIISWAPQLQVLRHSSLGGFLTHCGWNSVIENLSIGAVPMLCWPLGAEQNLNCRLIVDMWKIGIEVAKKDGIVGKSEVERAVRALMQGEERRVWKIRASRLKETLNMAVDEGGSSSKSVTALVEALKTKAASL